MYRACLELWHASSLDGPSPRQRSWVLIPWSPVPWTLQTKKGFHRKENADGGPLHGANEAPHSCPERCHDAQSATDSRTRWQLDAHCGLHTSSTGRPRGSLLLLRWISRIRGLQALHSAMRNYGKPKPPRAPSSTLQRQSTTP